MKIIPLNKISAISASSENSNFPADFLLNDRPKKVWKSTETGEATLTLGISGGTGGLALFNCNALSVAVSITDPNAVEWEDGVEWEAGVEWSTTDFDEITELANLDGNPGGAIWVEWGHSLNSLSAVLTLTGIVNEVLQCGVAIAGKSHEFSGPNYGITEGLIDLSIVKELSNGDKYVKQRDKLRTFDFSATVERDEQFYSFLYDIAREIGRAPAAWRLTKLSGFNWVVYARFDHMPSGRHDSLDYSNIAAKITEVV